MADINATTPSPSVEAQTTTNVPAPTKLVWSLSKPTPMWVTWIFRTEFVLNKVVLYILGSTALMTAQQVKESLVWIAAVDLFTWGIGRFIGLEKKDFENPSTPE